MVASSRRPIWKDWWTLESFFSAHGAHAHTRMRSQSHAHKQKVQAHTHFSALSSNFFFFFFKKEGLSLARRSREFLFAHLSPCDFLPLHGAGFTLSLFFLRVKTHFLQEKPRLAVSETRRYGCTGKKKKKTERDISMLRLWCGYINNPCTSSL